MIFILVKLLKIFDSKGFRGLVTPSGWTSAAYMSRGSRFIPQVVRSCIDICEACASECEKHQAEYCQKCAQACRQAAEEYRKITSVAGVA